MAKYILIIVVFSFVNYSYASSSVGFDEICRIYTEAINSSMKKDELSAYIFDNVNRRVNNKDAIQAHEAVFNVAPEERYSIFKQSAEFSLKRSWECDSVKILMAPETTN